MPTEPAPLTLADAVERAVEACDAGGLSATSAEVLERFADRDDPVASLEDPAEEIAEAFGAIDPQAEDPATQMIRAVTTFLAFRRGEEGDDDQHLLRLAARAEYDGDPPDAIRAWLDERGVEL